MYMKKYTLFLFILSFILLGSFGLNNKTASAANCAPGDLFNTTTGQPCGTTIPTACKAGDLYSSLTGQPCSGTSSGFYCAAQTNFQIGSKGDDVKTLQTQLNAQGENLKVDGSYGPLTQAAKLRHCPLFSSALSITTISLPSGTVGTAYSASVTGSGGSATNSYNWSVTGLPDGLQSVVATIACADITGLPCVNHGGVAIVGTPTTAGTYTVTVTLTSGSQTVSKQFSLVVAATGTTPPSACGPALFIDNASMIAAETKAGIKRGLAMGGFAFDGTNNMWVPITDLGGIGTNGFDSVMKITPSGDITTYTGTGIQPEAIGFDGTNMWTANGYSSVTKITPSGAMTTYKGGVQPNGVAFDGTNMWASDSGIGSSGSVSPGRVIKITPAGSMTTYIIGEDSHPESIAFDGTNMWTSNRGGGPVDNGAGSVTKITPSGVVTTYSSTEAFSPVAIAFDGTNMWTANAQSGPASGINSVTKITPSGAMTTYPGGHTQNKFFHPTSIAFDGTNMWTGNGDNITKITPLGAMTTYPLGTIGFGVPGAAYWLATSTVGKMVFDGTNMWMTTGGSGLAKINLSSACLPQSPALPVITNTSLPNGTLGSPYTVNLGSTVGAGLYRIWSVTGLPAGLSLNGVSYGAISGLQDTMYPGSGAPPTISGTPSAVGTYNVTVTLTTTSNYVSGCNVDGSVCYNPIYQTVSKQFTLVIAAGTGTNALTITTTSLPSGTVGTSYSASIAGSGGTSGYNWSVTGLPNGLQSLTNDIMCAYIVGQPCINKSSAAIAGTPTTAGTYTVTVTLNSGSQTVSKQFSLVINPAGTASYNCARCSTVNNYTYATFTSDSSDCNSTTAHNTNVVYSCDPSCGVTTYNQTYDHCGPS